MNIAILGARGLGSTYGGFETLVNHLTEHLLSSGHGVVVYNRDAFTGPKRSGLSVRHTRHIETRELSTLTHGFTAALDARGQDVDVALVLNTANGFFLPLLRERGIPVVLNVDGLEWERGKWGRVARLVFRAGATTSAKFANELIADSKVIQQYWHQRFGRSPVFIPYGGDTFRRPAEAESRSFSRRLGFEPFSFALVVARLVPENNVDFLLDVAARGRTPFVFIGTAPNGGREQKYVSRLRDLQARGRIQWLGHVSDPRHLWMWRCAAGVYVHGHSVGGTNPSLVEALAAGRPILAHDNAFNREVTGKSAQYFDASQPEWLAKQVDDLCSYPDSCTRRTKLPDRYMWSSVCRQYEALLMSTSRVRAGHSLR